MHGGVVMGSTVMGVRSSQCGHETQEVFVLMERVLWSRRSGHYMHNSFPSVCSQVNVQILAHRHTDDNGTCKHTYSYIRVDGDCNCDIHIYTSEHTEDPISHRLEVYEVWQLIGLR